MREIEFRAWLKDQEVMRNNVSFHGGNLWTGYSWIPLNENIELMQYTGLKDKNGVKIFEGDIVKVDYLQEKIFEIIFVNGGFKLKAKDCSTEYDYSITPTMIEENAIEVIGNIYKNKELLENE